MRHTESGEDFADDIVTALERWRAYRPILDGPILTDNASVTTALQALLNQHIADRRPIPGHSGSINLFAMALTLGCSRKEIERHRAEIREAAAIVGLKDRPWFDMPATAQLDGRPWIRAIVGSRLLDMPEDVADEGQWHPGFVEVHRLAYL